MRKILLLGALAPLLVGGHAEAQPSCPQQLPPVAGVGRCGQVAPDGFNTTVNPESGTLATLAAEATVSTLASGTVIIPDKTNFQAVNPSGTDSTLTVQLPTCSAAYGGMHVLVKFSQIVSTLTVTATAGTVGDAPAAAAIGVPYEWVCNGPTATWW